MATYNFKTGGDIEVDGVVKYIIEGAAVLTPNVVSGTFYLRYLYGSEFFYYPEGRFIDHVYQIDGETFEGTLTEFVDAANALYESAGGGGSYSFNNGINEAAGMVGLGGVLTASTIFQLQDGNRFEVLDTDLITSQLSLVRTSASYTESTIGNTTGYDSLGASASVQARTLDGSSDVTMISESDEGSNGAEVGVVTSASGVDVHMLAYDDNGNSSIYVSPSLIEFDGGAIKLPTMTKAERNAIASPDFGYMIFQTDNTPGLRVHNGTAWVKFTETTDA